MAFLLDNVKATIKVIFSKLPLVLDIYIWKVKFFKFFLSLGCKSWNGSFQRALAFLVAYFCIYISTLSLKNHIFLCKVAWPRGLGRWFVIWDGWFESWALLNNTFSQFNPHTGSLPPYLPPFPRKNMEKILTGWSLGTICLFKQKKIMVGHFEVGRYSHGRARDSVK